MKKITFLFILIGTLNWAKAQVLNQNAGWPNPAWTISGSYNTNPLAFEANPTTTANFAFDDDDAGSANDDRIAAESPIIDLTSCFTAGETWLTVTVQYGYRYLTNDQLRFEYWNADTSTWVAWGTNIPGNNTTVNDNFCTIPKTTYTTSILNIAGFSATQLSGFKYRISYDDNPAGAAWNWGFCFDSPTIISSTPPACPNPSALAAVPTITSATLSWTENGLATLYNIEYGINGFTPGSGTILSGVTNPFVLSPLASNTAYSYYVQAACGGTAGNSEWVGPFNFTTLFAPPANDECTGAIALTVNPDYSCGSVTSGTVAGATASSTNPTACFGTEDDDVWFSFIATSSSHKISLLNIAGSNTDMFHSLWTGNCSGLTLVPGSCSDLDNSYPSALTIGQTYYVRVNTYTATTGQNTTFNICIGTPPPPPANDECAAAIALTPGAVYSDHLTDTTNASATTSPQTAPTSCFGFSGGDIWFSVIVPASGSITIETGNSTTGATGIDTVVTAYSGDCSNLVQVGCDDDDAATGAYSLLPLTGLTPGSTLLLRVYEYGNDNSGGFAISVYDASLGNISFDNTAFSYFPNPVKNILTLTYNKEISNVDIFNLIGQKVSSNVINANEGQVDMSNLAKGVYLVKVTSNNLVKIIRVIKE